MTTPDAYKLIPYDGTDLTMCYAGMHYQVRWGDTGLEKLGELGKCESKRCPKKARLIRTDRMSLLEQQTFGVPKVTLDSNVVLVHTWKRREEGPGPNFEIIPHGSAVHTAVLRDSYIVRTGHVVFVQDNHQRETYYAISNTGAKVLSQTISPDEYRTRFTEREFEDRVRTLRKVGVPEGMAWRMIKAETARFSAFLFEHPYDTGRTQTRAVFEAVLSFFMQPGNWNRVAEFNSSLRMLRQDGNMRFEYERRIDAHGVMTALELIQWNIIRDDIFASC
jgi:hypothetical protein